MRRILVLVLVFALAGCVPVQQAVNNQLDALKVCMVDLVATQNVEEAKLCFARVAVAGGVEFLREQLEAYLRESRDTFLAGIWDIIRPPTGMVALSATAQPPNPEVIRVSVTAELSSWLATE